MKRLIPIAVLLCAALALPVASGGQTAAQDATPFTCDKQTAASHYKNAKKVIDAGWNWRNWRSGPKKVQSNTVQNHIDCLERRQDRDKIKDYRAERSKALSSYREYRQITPYRCQSGKYGTWSIPCAIISCESGFSWAAYNPSGASGPYQLLGWGAPMPANTWARKLEHHRIAHGLYAGGAGRSHWVC